MAAGRNPIAGGKFILAWNYENDTDVLDVWIVPANANRHIFHQMIQRSPQGDVGGSSEYLQSSDQAKAIVAELMTLGSLPMTYSEEAATADKGEQRQRRLARIAQLEAEAADLKTVVE